MTEQNTIEKETTAFDWKAFSNAPARLINPLQHIDLRLQTSIEKVKSKGAKKYLTRTSEMLRDYAEKIDSSFAPSPPRKLQDAYDYAKSRKYVGTYTALLDENGDLVKIVIVQKNEAWREFPDIKFEERQQEMTLNTRVMILEGTDFGKTDANPEGGRAVPKKVVCAVPFAYNGAKILNYEGKTVKANI